MKNLTPVLHTQGYTFAEVLVASALVGLVMGGAVALIGTMNLQEEASRITSVATNYAENAAKIWQLGQSQASVQALIPTPTDNPELGTAIVALSGTTQVTFANSGTHTLANSMGIVDKIDVSVSIRNPTGGTNRTYTVQSYLPQIR